MSQFQVNKTNFQKGKIVNTPSLDQLNLEDGEIIVKIDRFAYTSNNITYAVVGDMLSYWKFFPALGDDAIEEGVIPVWGFADVVKSNVSEIPEGDRLFGYFPPASFLKIIPKGITDRRLIDGSEHRAQLPIFYNMYQRVNAESEYSKATDDARMLLSPLHMTAFCLWDLLKEKNWYDAQQVIILSASSKTSIGLAYALNIDSSAPKVIGMTSPRNIDSVMNLNLYDDIHSYEEITEIVKDVPTVIVDMSGNKEVLTALFNYLGDQRKYCINVGITHWKHAGPGDDILKERSEFFFAPTQLQKLLKEWGPKVFAEKSSTFFKGSANKISNWLSFEKIDGLEGLAEIHPQVCKGTLAANKGLIVEM